MAAISRTAISPVQEARCPHILFEEIEGIYWLRKDNLARAKKLLKLSPEQKNVGFDAQTAQIYIDDLTEQGVTVGIIRGNTVRTISRQKASKPEKVQSKTVWLSPSLIFGQKELACINKRLNGNRFMVDGFMQRMQTEIADGDAIREFGTLYVYQVAEDIFEVDWELTTIPKPAVEALAVAAHQMGQSLYCQLIVPRPQRANGHRQTRKAASIPTPQFVVTEPVAYGQLRFEI